MIKLSRLPSACGVALDAVKGESRAYMIRICGAQIIIVMTAIAVSGCIYVTGCMTAIATEVCVQSGQGKICQVVIKVCR
ncbi:MAG: hypothetical protein AMXMBFR48_14820 [Ignavibacteriales bacterium]